MVWAGGGIEITIDWAKKISLLLSETKENHGKGGRGGDGMYNADEAKFLLGERIAHFEERKGGKNEGEEKGVGVKDETGKSLLRLGWDRRKAVKKGPRKSGGKRKNPKTFQGTGSNDKSSSDGEQSQGPGKRERGLSATRKAWEKNLIGTLDRGKKRHTWNKKCTENIIFPQCKKS